MEFLSIKMSTPCFFIRLKFLFKRKGGEIFSDHNLPSADQKIILDRQLASVLKLISDPEYSYCFRGWNIQQVTHFDNPNQI